MVIPTGRVFTRLLFSAKPQSAPLCRLHILHRSSRFNCPLNVASAGVGGARFATTKASKTKVKKTGTVKKKKPAAKTTATKRATTKKPAAKKKTVVKKKKRATATKKKPIKKKKAVKVVKKTKSKKVDSDTKARLKKLSEVRQLRLKALDPPKASPTSGWVAYVMERRIINPQLSEEFKALSAEEKQKYVDRGKAQGIASREELSKWVASRPPAVILEANKARARLKRLGSKTKIHPIPDPRKHKKPVTPTLLHMMDQYKSGRAFNHPDGSKMTVTEVMRVCLDEFNALPETEKEKYKEKSKQLRDEYKKAMTNTYGPDWQKISAK